MTRPFEVLAYSSYYDEYVTNLNIGVGGRKCRLAGRAWPDINILAIGGMAHKAQRLSQPPLNAFYLQ